LGPITAASAGLGVTGFMNAGFGFRFAFFFAGAFFIAFFFGFAAFFLAFFFAAIVVLLGFGSSRRYGVASFPTRKS
jgi:ABC-type Fe3+-siderophore transport system permease subunit